MKNVKKCKFFEEICIFLKDFEGVGVINIFRSLKCGVGI